MNPVNLYPPAANCNRFDVDEIDAVIRFVDRLSPEQIDSEFGALTIVELAGVLRTLRAVGISP